ncbi:hypothetical protein Q1695_015784 [Nippostrongylus brasiliensis]|nr:hypothetical protein Q1695_015784 [Nippostrongylus brasiliensis]
MLPIVVLLLLVATSATVNAQDAGMPEGGSGMEGSGCEGSGGEGSGCEASGEASGAPDVSFVGHQATEWLFIT